MMSVFVQIIVIISYYMLIVVMLSLILHIVVVNMPRAVTSVYIMLSREY
jgi:hypothetical protein